MKKLFSIIMCLAVFGAALFAQTYRYGILQAEGDYGVVCILDSSEALPDEVIDGTTIISLNTPYERFVAESGYNNIEDFYWDGSLILMYLNADTNEQLIIDWDQLIDLVRGEY